MVAASLRSAICAREHLVDLLAHARQRPDELGSLQRELPRRLAEQGQRELRVELGPVEAEVAEEQRVLAPAVRVLADVVEHEASQQRRLPDAARTVDGQHPRTVGSLSSRNSSSSPAPAHARRSPARPPRATARGRW